MAGNDGYVQSLGSIVVNSEKACLSPFELSANDDIISIISKVSSNFRELPNETKVKINEEVGKQMVLLSYLCFRLRYFKSKRLDFSNFPAMNEVAKILLLFTEKENVTTENLNLVNKIVQMLSEVDTVSIKARSGLGYRFLRLFMLLLLCGSYVNASVVATFIIEQMEGKR